VAATKPMRRTPQPSKRWPASRLRTKSK
jgi:hypothetical protein